MKKSIIYFFLTLLFSSCAVKKQIYLYGGSQPNLIYTTEVREEMNIATDFTGPENFLESIRKKYGKIPIILNGSNYWHYTTETGNLNEDSTFSEITTYGLVTLDTDNNGEKTSEEYPMSRSIVKGYINNKGKFVLDTVISKGDLVRIKAIIESMEKRSEIDTFPSINLKVGDEFKKTSTLSLPFSHKLEINSTFKLRKIHNNRAFFDVIQIPSVDESVYKGQLEVLGSGKGKYIFELRYKCFIKKVSTMNLSLTRQYNDSKIYQKVYKKSNVITNVTNH